MKLCSQQGEILKMLIIRYADALAGCEVLSIADCENCFAA